MLAKLRQRRGPAPACWTGHPFGRSLLQAEYRAQQELVAGYSSPRIIELSSAEIPPTGLPVEAVFEAARATWRSPVIASVAELPLLDRSVEIILWRFLALEQVHRQRLLINIERVLTPNGILICSHLQPMHAGCWRRAGTINLGRQSASMVLPAAVRAGLRVRQSRLLGPGWWKFRALKLSVLQKPLARTLRKRAYDSRTQRRPASALGSFRHRAGTGY